MQQLKQLIIDAWKSGSDYVRMTMVIAVALIVLAAIVSLAMTGGLPSVLHWIGVM